MYSRSSVKTAKKQQGLALLILVIVIVLVFTAISLSEISINEVNNERAKSTQLVLKKAKQAVINYAITYADRAGKYDYGLLPCPEELFNGDYGNMTGNCGFKNRNVIGWFPWRSLDLVDLKDDSGTCLFYAVSGTYRVANTTQADMINEDSIGMFQILNSAGEILQGSNIEDQVVALIIAPGGPLTGQVRTPLDDKSNCGRDYGNDIAYLEGDGVTNNSDVSTFVDTVDEFIHATETSDTEAIPYNDKFVTINRSEIWDVIVERSDFKQDMENLTQALAMCLASYANLAANTSRRLPWPVKTNLNAGDYRVNANYQDDNAAASGYSGRFPFDVTNSNITNTGVYLSTELFTAASCNALVLTGSGLGVTVDLVAATSKYRKLWDNWKDHFFYILSKGYEPANTVEIACAASACVTVNTTPYAGAVIFSGSRLAGISRNDKSIVSEYLEDGKGTEFVDEADAANQTGDRDYGYTDPQTVLVNDVMYCIEDKAAGIDLDVVECGI